MPRRSPLSERESHICHRLAEARTRAGFSRSELGAQIGISVSKLVSYEHGRTPVPYAVAAKIAEATDLNQRWLASGIPPRKPYLEVAPHIEEAIPKRLLFSEAFDLLLSVMVNERISLIARDSKCEEKEIENLGYIPDFEYSPLGTPPDEARLYGLRRNSNKWLAALFMVMPPSLYNAFERDYKALVDRFVAKTKKTGRVFNDAAIQRQKVREEASVLVTRRIREERARPTSIKDKKR